MTLAIAPDSWGVWFANDPQQSPWNRYLDEIVAAGFRNTELGPYGYMPTDPQRLREELGSRDLSLLAGAVMFDLEDSSAAKRAAEEAERVCSTLSALGGSFLVIIDDVYTDLFTGEQRLPAELDDRGWAQLTETTVDLCRLAERYGLLGVFHPHAQCHVEYETQIERLLMDAPEVSLCLDVGHHAYCGGDPVAFARRHPDRIGYMHLKSVDGVLAKHVRDNGIPFAQAVADGVFVEPSQGIVDFQELLDVIQEIGYRGFATIEQDMYPASFDKPLPIATRTREYLTGLGWS